MLLEFRKSVFISIATVLTTGLSLLASGDCQAKSTVDWEKKLKKGNHELQIGNTDKALEFFQKMVKANPQSGACHTGLGKCLKRYSRLSEAKESFRTATRVEPSYKEGFYELGAICEGDKEWREAANAFKSYLALETDGSKKKTVEERMRHCQNQQ